MATAGRSRPADAVHPHDEPEPRPVEAQSIAQGMMQVNTARAAPQRAVSAEVFRGFSLVGTPRVVRRVVRRSAARHVSPRALCFNGEIS
jgi:hypothetical protein